MGREVEFTRAFAEQGRDKAGAFKADAFIRLVIVGECDVGYAIAVEIPDGECEGSIAPWVDGGRGEAAAAIAEQDDRAIATAVRRDEVRRAVSIQVADYDKARGAARRKGRGCGETASARAIAHVYETSLGARQIWLAVPIEIPHGDMETKGAVREGLRKAARAIAEIDRQQSGAVRYREIGATVPVKVTRRDRKVVGAVACGKERA